MIDDNSPISDEIYKILNNTEQKSYYRWDVYFRIRQPCPIELPKYPEKEAGLVPEQEKENIYRPLKLLNFDTSRDYELASGDDSSVTAVFTLGLWYKILEPCRDYLEAVVTRYPQKPVSREEEDSSEENTQVYYAIPKVSKESVGQANNLDKISRVALDLTGLIDIEFQLMDLSMEQLRSVYVGGIFRKSTAFDTMRAAIAKETAGITIENDSAAIESYKFYEADNTEEREHIVVPQATQLFDLPAYLQSKCGGIYSTGIGIYLQNKELYVYPPYNTKRFDEEDKTLTILKLPDAQYEQSERTFRIDGSRVIILAQSESDFKHVGNSEFRNEYSGIKFADARKFMDTLVETKDNKAMANRAKINHEYLYKDIKVKEESNNKVERSQDTIHANPFKEDSLLSMKDGSFLAFKWMNSDASLLYPAMPVKILYMSNDELIELRGTLLKVMHSTQLMNRGITSSSYIEQTALYVYVRPVEESQ